VPPTASREQRKSSPGYRVTRKSRGARPGAQRNTYLCCVLELRQSFADEVVADMRGARFAVHAALASLARRNAASANLGLPPAGL
jgi:hypothetical protein